MVNLSENTIKAGVVVVGRKCNAGSKHRSLLLMDKTASTCHRSALHLADQLLFIKCAQLVVSVVVVLNGLGSVPAVRQRAQ